MANFDPPAFTEDKIRDDFWLKYPNHDREIIRFDFTQRNPIGGNAYWFSSPRMPITFTYYPNGNTVNDRLRVELGPGD